MVLRGVSLFFSGLFAGFLVCVMVLETSLRSFGAGVYTQVRLVELDSLDKLASVTLIPAIVTTVAVVIRSRGDGRRLAITAVALLVIVFVTTLAVNLSINSDQSSWSVQQPPADWAGVRDRWQIAHAVRTVAAVAAFGLLVGAAVRRRSGGRSSSPAVSGVRVGR
ncbi:anthrone oxygenase family protein [Kribbella sp. NPDC051936]|uniref:anthrone oxygenase family protein n=1 Tax=Kribbella sp. NPDC051936 TaxID=3154946 RepID=UPI00343FB813